MKKIVRKRLNQYLKELRLPTFQKFYSEQADLARQESFSFEEYLMDLVELELETRRENRIVKYLRTSKIPIEKNLAAFDRKRLPQKVNAQISALVDGSFISRSENILAFGNPGSGKTHLLCALGQELIHQGYRVLFKPCSLLVQELLVAKRDLKLPQYLKKIASNDALIIDDMGYVQQSQQEMEVLFTLLADRYERTSILITSNLAFSQWDKIFKDPMTTAAAIDRLVHHSVILELNLTSYRLEQSKKNSKGLLKQPI
ncbi:DNA replication protein DnaC [bacterium BMS3Abin05]|nr:DNA replication protein DnaC [bacterium BMS3Abin05]